MYKQMPKNQIRKDLGNESFIFFDPDTDTYEKELYDLWVAEGNTIEPFQTQAEIDAQAAIDARRAEIETEKATSGLREVTVTEAFNYIDTQLDNATTAAQTKEAIRRILKRMVPYLLT